MNHVADQIHICSDKDTSIKLTGAILKKECKTDEYTLDLTYILDSPTKTQALHIPRVVLPLNTKCINFDRYDDVYHILPEWNYFVDLGFGEMRLLPDKDGLAFRIKTIEEKTKEMTLEEIEKKLGHKVKIVSKEK